MLSSEVIRTCSNAHVAGAAIASSGCRLRARVELLAKAFGLDRGVYTASLVREFALCATADQWQGLELAMDKQDMPLLAGLRFIVETALENCDINGDDDLPLDHREDLIAALRRGSPVPAGHAGARYF